MIVLWFSAAFAGLPPEYPLWASFDLPEAGVVALEVPLELRSADDPPEPSDLLLIDRDGNPVPVVRVDQPRAYAEGPALIALPEPGGSTWTVDVGERAVHALRVDPGAGRAVRVEVQDALGQELGAGIGWAGYQGQQGLIPLGETAGKLRLELSRPVESLLVTPLRVETEGPEPHRFEVPVSPPRMQENGYYRYDFTLERPLPLTVVRPRPLEEIFERSVGVEPVVQNELPGFEGSVWLYPSNPQTIQRVNLGRHPVEQVEVPVGGRGQRYALLLEASGGPPLTLPTVEVELRGVVLLAVDPGPGPHRLLGGALPNTTPVTDLAVARPELLRQAGAPVRAGPVEANPDYVSPVRRSGLLGAGRSLDRERFRFAAPLLGEGMSRFEVPPEALREARPDLGDLRILAGRRQVPYVLRRAAGDTLLPTTEQREEKGSETWLRVKLPDDGLPVSTIELRSPATHFSRGVRLASVSGNDLNTLRYVHWTADGQPGLLTVQLDQVLPGELVVQIDHGDDPPLVLDPVAVRRSGWEVVAEVPAGSELVFGQRSLDAPDYDLNAVSDLLRREVVQTIEVGPVQGVVRPALAFFDRVLVAVGLGALVLALGVVLVSLLRRPPSAPTAEPPAEDTPPAPPEGTVTA